MTAPERPRFIYHIVPADVWRAGADDSLYRADSLDTEGFLHASTAEQLYDSADRHFAGREGLLALRIDTELVSAPLRYEIPDHDPRAFPHVYGPLERSAVVDVRPLTIGRDGRFERAPLES